MNTTDKADETSDGDATRRDTERYHFGWVDPRLGPDFQRLCAALEEAIESIQRWEDRYYG